MNTHLPPDVVSRLSRAGQTASSLSGPVYLCVDSVANRTSMVTGTAKTVDVTFLQLRAAVVDTIPDRWQSGPSVMTGREMSAVVEVL